MKYLLDVFKGIALGAGAILPGISSGVLCVIFGIYEKLVDSILNFFKDIKTNFKFLFPIAIGGLIGMLLFGNILKYLFYAYPTQTKFSFIGLILGSIPILFKKANKPKGFRLHYMLYLLIAFFIGFMSIKLENLGISFISGDFSNNTIFLIIAGFFMSVGVVVPGVSSSVILMSLGFYDLYLSAISTMYLPVLIPMAVGVIIGGLIVLKIIQTLLNNYFPQTFYAIIGFVIGSVFILYPGLTFNLEGLISLILFVICFFIALQFEKLDNK